MTKTLLKKWHDVDGVYTRDTWEIPEAGTDIWCTGWKRGQIIKLNGDGAHVIVGFDVYHCDELMGILDRWVIDGYTWGIEGIEMIREQQIDDRWRRVTI